MVSYNEYLKMAKKENLAEFKFTNTDGIQKTYLKENGAFRLKGGARTKIGRKTKTRNSSHRVPKKQKTQKGLKRSKKSKKKNKRRRKLYKLGAASGAALTTAALVAALRKNSNLPPKDKFWIDSMSHGPVEWRDITKV